MYRVLQYVGPTHNSDGQESVNSYQHRRAVQDGKTNKCGRALIGMLRTWEDYRSAYHDAYDDPAASSEVNEMDCVVGRYWAEVGLSIKRLLDGECGGLDCGSIAANITAMIEAEGFETDGYSIKE